MDDNLGDDIVICIVLRSINFPLLIPIGEEKKANLLMMFEIFKEVYYNYKNRYHCGWRLIYYFGNRYFFIRHKNRNIFQLKTYK